MAMTAATLALGLAFSYAAGIPMPGVSNTQATVVVSTFSKSPAEQAITVTACADTDTGIFYGVQGKVVIDQGAGRKEIATDACMSPTVLRENWCARSSRGKSYIQAADITCKFGCSNGACGSRTGTAANAVTARIVDASGKPVQGAAIIMIGSGEFYDRGFSDSNGMVTLQGISKLSAADRATLARRKASVTALNLVGSTYYEADMKYIDVSLASANDAGTFTLNQMPVGQSKFFRGVASLNIIRDILSPAKPATR